ncbi:hypothetical protein OIV83_001701 [Microbotryomycetes sp. JL201]|nr:hypothetical protein OIV83_001701 [Microbotryomycetes sp. JL201]
MASQPAKRSRTSTGLPEGAPPLGKFLASSEKHIRDKAVAALAKFLRGKQKRSHTPTHAVDDVHTASTDDQAWQQEWTPDSRLGPKEMAKLWKGVFFCFWMSDKPLVQQALATDLANLVLEVRPNLKPGQTSITRVHRFRAAMCYLGGFWHATTREWAGLDRLRLDKFYMLVRRFVNVAFRLLEREEWDLHAITEYNQLLTGENGPLDVLNQRIPDSLAYHLCDISVDELEKVCLSASTSTSTSSSSSSSSSTQHDVPLVALLQPFLHTMAISPTSTMFKRVTDNVVEPLLQETLPEAEAVGSKRKKRKLLNAEGVEDVKYTGIYSRAKEGSSRDMTLSDERRNVGVSLLQAVFEMAGKETTTDVNRRRMYKLVKDKEESSGVEI